MNALVDPIMTNLAEARFLLGNEPILGPEGDYFPKKPPLIQMSKCESISKIDKLNLERYRAKLCKPIEEDGKGWSEQRAMSAERFYKMFLKLCLLYPNLKIAPLNRDSDKLWHKHILDMKRYENDCLSIFGYQLYHLPSNGPYDEVGEWKQTTLQLFKTHFGVDNPQGSDGKCKAGECCCPGGS